MTIIGLSGFARSGKDTIADYLVKRHKFTRVAFADPMREALIRLDPWIQMDGMPRVPLSQALRVYDWEDLKHHSEDIRPLLQRMGTEVGRGMFGQDFWVDYAIGQSWQYERVVFSDVRFLNEVEAVHKNWGVNWRVNRPGVGPANEHVSEKQLIDYKQWDEVIDNDGSLTELYKKVDLLIEEMNI